MQAIPGPRPSLIREVQAYVLGDDGFGEDLDWGHNRGRDFQCLATIVFLISNHPSTSFPTSLGLEKWLMSAVDVPDTLHDAVLDTFQIFIALVKNKKYNTAFQKPARVSPVEFTMIGVLIYLYKGKYSLMQLSSAIWQMRADIRKRFQDIRANSKVTKAMFDFLKQRLMEDELASDGKGDTPAILAIKKTRSVDAADKSRVVDAPSATKRRRRQEPETSEDSEYEAVPPTRRVSMPQLPRATTSKATAPRTTVVRKVSAVASSSATTKKAAGKAKSSKTAQTSSSRARAGSSAQSATPATAKTSTGIITKRTTRTSQSAAADSVFEPETSVLREKVSIPIPPSLSRKRTTTAAVAADSVEPEHVVKMEVDPPPSVDSNRDDNEMSVKVYVAMRVTLTDRHHLGLSMTLPKRHRWV